MARPAGRCRAGGRACTTPPSAARAQGGGQVLRPAPASRRHGRHRSGAGGRWDPAEPRRGGRVLGEPWQPWVTRIVSLSWLKHSHVEGGTAEEACPGLSPAITQPVARPYLPGYALHSRRSCPVEWLWCAQTDGSSLAPAPPQRRPTCIFLTSALRRSLSAVGVSLGRNVPVGAGQGKGGRWAMLHHEGSSGAWRMQRQTQRAAKLLLAGAYL